MPSITSGTLKGLVLKSPEGAATRPTGQKTRQAIFNILRNYGFDGEPILSGAAVADVFAGTGSLGIEAISNGASHCVFVESERAALRVLRQNTGIAREKWLKQGLPPISLDVLSGDAFNVYPKLPQVRVLFADAPYKVEASKRLLEAEKESHRISRNGLFIMETAEDEAVQEECGRLKRFDLKIYGDTAVHFFVKIS